MLDQRTNEDLQKYFDFDFKKNIIFTMIFTSGFVHLIFISNDKLVTMIMLCGVTVVKTFFESIYFAVTSFIALKNLQSTNEKKQ
jgi:hypothetical protein